MRYSHRFIGFALAVVLLTGIAAAKPHPRKASAATKAKSSAKSKSSSKGRKASRKSRSQAHRVRGQQSIDSARAYQIQEALIRESYLAGEPTGNWDERTKEAMARYQADHGWQTKMLPDSRALIKLGLGPDHTNLLNSDVSGLPATAGVSTARQQ